MQISFTEHQQIVNKNFNSVSEVEKRIIILKENSKGFGFFQQDELATLQCWLYNRHRGPGMMELTKEAFN
jgi:hypothetical protein